MLRMSHNGRGYMLFTLILLLQIVLQLRLAESRCARPDDLANGSIIQRRNYLRFRCNNNYVLMGKITLTCGMNGRLSGDRPFCARPGCIQPQDPEYGEIEVQRGIMAVVICKEEFVAAGNALAYCNGNTWDRPLGICRHRNHSQSHSCDFESEDMCGWVNQLTLIQPWRRVATVSHFHSYRTGPRHDHTLQSVYGGHYMLMESTSSSYGVHHFISPIYPRELSLKTACCFRFHYFMYGSGVGDLVVSVKPHQMRVEQMWSHYQNNYRKFNISGNQGNQWLEHTISIDEMNQDFQVVFTATDASSQFGDIAIDDVRLMTGRECGGGAFTTTTEPPVVETLEPVVYDMMNCSKRCHQPAPLEDELREDGKLIKSCGCDVMCLVQDNCCNDFMSTCIYPYEETTAEDPTTTTTTTRRTTTSTTTTTTPKPTTTSSTTSTTTRRIPKFTIRPNTTTRRIPTTAKTTTTTTSIPTPTSTTTTTQRTTTSTTAATTATTTTARQTPTTSKTTYTTPKAATTTTKTTTIRTTTSTTKPHDKPLHPTPHHGSRVTWAVHPDDLKGDSDKQSNPARFMWLLMIGIMLVIIVGSIVYRWDRTRGATIEKAVSFQKKLANLKNATLSRGNRSRKQSEANSPLCDNIVESENPDYDGVQFEEMGVDIRNVSEL